MDNTKELKFLTLQINLMEIEISKLRNKIKQHLIRIEKLNK